MTSSDSYIVAIPARYASTRLAAKPLALVGGKPMIMQVCLKALASQASAVVACIDHEAVKEALQPLSASEPRLRICMTSDKPRSGTERIAEMLLQEHYPEDTIVVNVQGDEPLIRPEHIDEVARLIRDTDAHMSTLCSPITEVKDVFDPNCVKVVFNQDQRALYFSRAPIPFERDNFMKLLAQAQAQAQAQAHAQTQAQALSAAPAYAQELASSSAQAAGNSTATTGCGLGFAAVTKLECTHYHHIGIYGYKVKTILDYLQRAPAAIEQAESLEQLRLLHYGMSIVVATTDRPPEAGVDTQADLDRVNRILANAAN